MIESQSRLVQNLLARPEIHKQWSRHYRTSDNESFYELDYILRVLNPSPGATFLDAGCGSCAHSVRLARRGFNVQAVDLSESALAMAEDYVKFKDLQDQIMLGPESLLELSFPTRVLTMFCVGVC